MIIAEETLKKQHIDQKKYRDKNPEIKKAAAKKRQQEYRDRLKNNPIKRAEVFRKSVERTKRSRMLKRLQLQTVKLPAVKPAFSTVQVRNFKENIEASKVIDSEIAVLQVDWAENYKCFNQDETQAAHFGQNQVSIFTAARWHHGIKSFAIVSDDLDHTKTSVVANMNKILSMNPVSVKILHIYSDNATSQFKNKDTMNSIIALEKLHKLKIFWHFFAAMHGKGAVDGIGAVVKNTAARKVLANRTMITNAETFAQELKSCKIEVIWLSKEEKKQRNSEVGLSKLVANSKKLKDISKCHFFFSQNNKIECKTLSP